MESYAAAPNPEIDQIGRWTEPVCVHVLGVLRPDQAAKIKARIETVAQSLGVPAAAPNCHANVEIAFTGHPQDVMDFVAKRREDLLGYTAAMKCCTCRAPSKRESYAACETAPMSAAP